jgi:hypothetical protein
MEHMTMIILKLMSATYHLSKPSGSGGTDQLFSSSVEASELPLDIFNEKLDATLVKDGRPDGLPCVVFIRRPYGRESTAVCLIMFHRQNGDHLLSEDEIGFGNLVIHPDDQQISSPSRGE